MIRHDRGEGVGRVDDGDDALVEKILPETGNAAKAAGASRQGQRARVGGMARERDHGANLGCLFGQELIERSRFAGAAEDEDRHGTVFA